jgi:hypothetical protein
MPTSRTMRVRPAISLGDSIRQTASMVRWMSRLISADVTAIDHTTFGLFAQAGRGARGYSASVSPATVLFSFLAGKFSRLKHLTNFGLAFPPRPMFLMKLHKAHR